MDTCSKICGAPVGQWTAAPGLVVGTGGDWAIGLLGEWGGAVALCGCHQQSSPRKAQKQLWLQRGRVVRARQLCLLGSALAKAKTASLMAMAVGHHGNSKAAGIPS